MIRENRLKALREIQLRNDRYYSRAQDFGRRAAASNTRRQQMSGLANVANTTRAVSNVLDFVKLRCARHKEWRAGNWGPELLAYLDQDLRGQQEEIRRELGFTEHSAEALHLYVLLVREFVRQLAAQYEYERWQLEEGSRA